MKIDSNIVNLTQVYVKDYLSKHLDKNFLFHDLYHTASVVKAVNRLCDEEGIEKQEKRILLVAAWFHDLGYTEQIDKHEDISASFAEKFLQGHYIDQSDIDKVKGCVLATRYPQIPHTTGEMILCDADMSHLADKNCTERSDMLRKEWAVCKNKVYTDAEWLDLNISFLSKHSYHTGYGKQIFEKNKNKNIKKLIALQQSTNKGTITSLESETDSGRKKQKKDKQDEYGRGVETLFKIASANHMRLSGMADNKAHILLSINSIIIFICISKKIN